MPKYNVTAYAVVRVRIENVQADDHQAALVKAEEATNYHKLFNRDLVLNGTTRSKDHMAAAFTAYAEEFTGFLVDEHNDPMYARSVSYGADHRPVSSHPAEVTAGDLKRIPEEQVEDLAQKMYRHDDPRGLWHLARGDEQDAYRAYARIALGLPTDVDGPKPS